MLNGQSSLFTPVDYHLYADNMTITAQVVKDGLVLTEAEIGVFANGDECLADAVVDGEGRAYITVPGDDTCLLTFKVVVNGQLFTTDQSVNFEIDGEYGSYSQPFVLTLGVTDGIAEMEQVVKTPDSVYDLSGRKLVKGKYGNNRLSKGVYIENGNKKVLK
jgi:hypothetical protein